MCISLYLCLTLPTSSKVATFYLLHNIFDTLPHTQFGVAFVRSLQRRRPFRSPISSLYNDFNKIDTKSKVLPMHKIA